jgi:hypothetical protein
MSVTYPYTTEGDVAALAGQFAIDLRLDDSADAAADMEWGIDAGTSEADFYLQDYSQTDLAASDWVQKHATYFALRALCQRRLNDVPEALAKECERREKQLTLVLQRKARAPRIAKSRRPVAVTNYTVDLRRFNGPVRVDKNRSTGQAKDYRRATDNSPDER